MSKSDTWRMTVIANIALVVVIVIVAVFHVNSNASFKDAGSAIAFITAAAVAIERILEGMWTILGGILGTYWPLSIVNQQVNVLVGELNQSVTPFYDGLKKQLDGLAAAGKLTQEELTSSKGEIDRLKARFDDFVKVTPDNQRIQLMTAAATQNVSYLYEKYHRLLPDLEYAVGVANTSVNGVQDFLASFKDNPGRRLISIYLGAMLGLMLAGFLGLDVFRAVLDKGANLPYPTLNILFTGFLIGLGSNPTHEVIRAIQEYKKNQKGENTSKPDLPSKA